MKTTAPSEGDASITPLRTGFYQRALEQSLGQMQLGCLHVTLPGGSTRRFGRGSEVTAHLRVNRLEFYRRCVLHGHVGFGESFVDGDWDTDDLPAVLGWFWDNLDHSPLHGSRHSRPLVLNLLGFADWLGQRLGFRAGVQPTAPVADSLGPKFYQLMLDEGLTPSCGIWTRDDQTLEEAQTAKYEAICRTLRLKPTDLVLEVGSSWGGLACHAVKKYGCHVTTLARSKAEHHYCRERFVREGVGDNAAVRREDFLALEGRFDKIVSLEGLDTVGERRVDDFFAQCHELLKHHGLVALQFVTCPDSRYRDLTHGLDWVQKHVNPAERPLSLGRVTEALQRETDLQLFELRDLGLHYVRTLRESRRRFQANRDAVRQLKLDDRFIRQWHYYLCYREALFAQRNASVVHAVYTRPHNRTLMAPPPAASPASA